MSLREEKKEIRERILLSNSQLDRAYKERADTAIRKLVEGHESFMQATSIFTYVSMKDEVDTMAIIELALSMGKVVAVPKNLERGIMGAFIIEGLDDLEGGYFGTQEPKKGARMIKKDAIDFAIIPCVTVDNEGYRVGYGGGYYDRYLSDAVFPTGVLCREKGKIKQAPQAIHDQQIKYVISELGIIETKKN